VAGDQPSLDLDQGQAIPPAVLGHFFAISTKQEHP
jgi:hypothetical protein